MVMRRPVVVVMSGVSVVVVGASLQASRSGPSASRAGTSVASVVTAATLGTAATAPAPAVTTAAPAPRATTARAVPSPTATHRVRHTAAPQVTAAPKATTAPAVTVNGAAYDTRYGPVQVQIEVRSGRIVRADAIEYPQGGDRDQEINSYAVPQLDQETLNAQSARIDTVSGATYTSEGYRSSLQSAIDAAHRAGAL